MNKCNRILSAVFIAVFIFCVTLTGIILILKNPDEISVSERRKLVQKPVIGTETIFDGTFFENTEKYLLDQFPLRDLLKRTKAITRFFILCQNESHGITVHNGSAIQLYGISEKSVNVYIKRLNAISDFFRDHNADVYHTVIPDKADYINKVIPTDHQYAYDKISSSVSAVYIDITDTLSLDSYYKTDIHWTQDRLLPTSEKINTMMGALTSHNTYIKDELSPFYGVLYGQSSLPFKPDTIKTVSSPVIDNAGLKRINIEKMTLTEGFIYDDAKLSSYDPYDVFLGGASTVYILDNNNRTDGKTLYLISDSFGRSLAPLLLEGYSKIVFFDIRYIPLYSAADAFPIVDDCDVLIAYSFNTIDVSDTLQID